LTMNMAERISRYFALRGAVTEEDREVLAFMLFHILALVQQVLVLTVIAASLDSFLQATVCTLFFASLKRYAGGAHANKHWVCLTMFAGLTTAVCLISKFVAVPPYVAIGASVVALALVLLRSPVIHPNNPKPERRRKIMRSISICIAIAQCTLVAAGSVIWPAIAMSGALGGMMAAIALLLPMPDNET